MKETQENYLHGVLYPTDFSVRSLAGLRTYLEHHKGGAIRLVLVHGYTAPDSISELFFFSPPNTARELADEKFMEGCAILKNRFAFIASLGLTVFTGRNQAAFDNFVAGYGIREAVFPHDHTPQSLGRRSFDLTPFIRDSQLKITPVNLPPAKAFAATPSQTLSDLFENQAGKS